MFHPKVSVCILNFNTQKWLETFLPKIVASKYDNLEIVLIDNASNDNSVAFVKQYYPTIKTIVLPQNYGYAGGYNEGLKQVNAEIYVLLNSDVEVTENWILPVVEAMEKDKSIAAAQPVIKAYSDKNYFEYAGASGGFIDSLGYPFCRGRIFDVSENDLQQYPENIEVFWTSGAAMFVRAAVFHEHEGFDADFFVHMEEIDLCWRFKNAGYKLICVTDSEVYHVGGGTLAQGSDKKKYYNFRNGLIMNIKNMPGLQLLWKLPLRILLDWLAALVFIFYKDFKGMKAVFKAHWNIIYRFYFWYKKRRKTHQKVVVRNYEGIYKGSIVWQFFINKKKYYQQLFD